MGDLANILAVCETTDTGQQTMHGTTDSVRAGEKTANCGGLFGHCASLKSISAYLSATHREARSTLAAATASVQHNAPSRPDNNGAVGAGL
jgi:hypothetical protein